MAEINAFHFVNEKINYLFGHYTALIQDCTVVHFRVTLDLQSNFLPGTSAYFEHVRDAQVVVTEILCVVAGCC